MMRSFTLLAVAGILTLCSSVQAATFVVGTTTDAGANSFRVLVAGASAGDTITFDPSLNGMAMTISGTPVVIDKGLTVLGNGTGNTIFDGSNSTRLLSIIDPAMPVAFRDIQFRNGQATRGGGLFARNSTLEFERCSFTGNAGNGNNARDGGGAMYLDNTSLSLLSCDISNNTANGTSGSGGGIFTDTGSSINAQNTTFGGNSAARAGGAIEHAVSGTEQLLCSGCVFLNNTASSNPGNGGAIHVTGDGYVGVRGGSASGNVAASEGGAFWNGTGTMRITTVAITNNTANGTASDNGGGGLFNAGGTLIVLGGTVLNGNLATMGSGSGGAIFNDAGGRLVVIGSSMSNNQAARAGGGIEDNSGAGTAVLLRNCSLETNTTGSNPGNGGGLHVTGAGDVDLVNVTVNGNTAAREGGGLWNGSGLMRVRSSNVTNNVANGDMATQGGGGIFNNGGTLQLTSTNVTGNQAMMGSGSGGGIFSSTNGNLSVRDGVIGSNMSARAGGGVEIAAGSGSVSSFRSVQFDANSTGSSPGNGGGLHITGDGIVNVMGCTVSNNTAASEGGGLWNNTGSMNIENTVFTSNSSTGAAADQGGGALYNEGGTLMVSGGSSFNSNTATGASGSGGAIFNNSGGSLRVVDAAFTNNSASRAGGAIEDAANSSSRLVINRVTASNNSASAAPGNGGFLHITGSTSSAVFNSSFNNNTAASEGGALWNGTGRMSVRLSDFSSNVASGDDSDTGGGAIYSLRGELVVVGSDFTSNMADGTSGSGGAILLDSAAALVVVASTFDGNSASRAGGAIEDNSGAASFVKVVASMFENNSTAAAPGNGGAFHITGPGRALFSLDTIQNNSASNQGGGLWAGSGSFELRNSFVTGNSAPLGGGLYNVGGNVNVVGSTISGNFAAGNSTPIAGGGVFNANGGQMTIIRSTITANSSDGNAGALANGGTTTITASTIAANTSANRGGGIGQTATATSVTLRSSIVAANSTGTQGQDVDLMSGVYLSEGYNLIGNDDGNLFPAMATDLEGSPSSPIDPMVGPLADNGGPTPTHALLPGSPAIDAGDPGLTMPDQRGEALMGQRDIGAYEFSSTARGLVSEDASLQFGSTSEGDAAMRVFPTVTRANSSVTVQTQAGQRVAYELYNSAGSQVQAGYLEGQRAQLPLQGLATDTYILQVFIDGEAHTERIIIAK